MLVSDTVRISSLIVMFSCCLQKSNEHGALQSTEFEVLGYVFAMALQVKICKLALAILSLSTYFLGGVNLCNSVSSKRHKNCFDN